MMKFADERNPLTEDEWPDEGDRSEDDGETDLIACGACGKLIAEESPQCPYCKTWGPFDAAGELSGTRRTVWALIVIATVAVILIVWHGLGW